MRTYFDFISDKWKTTVKYCLIIGAVLGLIAGFIACLKIL